MASDQQLLSTCQGTREQSIEHNIPEEQNLNQHQWQNLKSPTTQMEKPLSFYIQFGLNDEDTVPLRNVCNYQSTRRDVPGDLNIDR